MEQQKKRWILEKSARAPLHPLNPRSILIFLGIPSSRLPRRQSNGFR
jgi:hypothetical protein